MSCCKGLLGYIWNCTVDFDFGLEQVHSRFKDRPSLPMAARHCRRTQPTGRMSILGGEVCIPCDTSTCTCLGSPFSLQRNVAQLAHRTYT